MKLTHLIAVIAVGLAVAGTAQAKPRVRTKRQRAKSSKLVQQHDQVDIVGAIDSDWVGIALWRGVPLTRGIIRNNPSTHWI